MGGIPQNAATADVATSEPTSIRPTVLTLDNFNSEAISSLDVADQSWVWSTNLPTNIGKVSSRAFDTVASLKREAGDLPDDETLSAIGLRVDFLRRFSRTVRFSLSQNNTPVINEDEETQNTDQTRILTSNIITQAGQGTYPVLDGYPTEISVWVAGRGVPFSISAVFKNKKGDFFDFPLQSTEGDQRLNFMGFKRLSYTFMPDHWSNISYLDALSEEFAFVGFEVEFLPFKAETYYIYFSGLEIKSNNYFHALFRDIDTW